MNEDRLARDVKGLIEESTGESVEVSASGGIVTLAGTFSSLDKAIDAGHMAAEQQGVRQVVSDIDYPGAIAYQAPRKVSDELSGRQFDVVVIGGGVIGVALARELARFNLSIAVIERHDDLGMDQTFHSCAMVHPAVTAEHGTLKWEMNYKSNAMWDDLARELDFGFKRIGTLIVAESENDEQVLPYIAEAARKHNDPDPTLLSRKGLDKVEPGLAPHVRKGIHVWNTGIVSVFDLVLAYAENAMLNGVEFFVNTPAIGVTVEDQAVTGVTTARGHVTADIVVNAAGLYSDRVAESAGDRFFTIHPRRGETLIFDKAYQPVRTVLGTVSMAASRTSPYSKGGGIIPTVEGNLQFGPTAKEVVDREDTATTCAAFDELFGRFAPVLERLKPDYERPRGSNVITHFAGCRAATYKEDFIIEPSRKIRGLVHAAGIQSPGLASAPAIAARIREIFVDEWNPAERDNYTPQRKAVVRFSNLGRREQHRLVKEDPLSGHIVCRCESVTESEVVGSLHGEMPATTVDGVKRRTRAGMGRCQGGFCLPRIMEIMSREMGVDKGAVTKKDGRSFVLDGRTKKVLR